MKKQYMAPATEVVAIGGEEMICTSIADPRANGIKIGSAASDDEEFAKDRGWLDNGSDNVFGW